MGVCRGGRAGVRPWFLAHVGRELAPALVGPVPVVVILVPAEDATRMGLVHDQHVVRGFPADRADHALAVGVHSRRPGRAEQHGHVLWREDGVEGLGVFGVAVGQHETQGLHPCAEVSGEVARLLHRPLAGRVGDNAGQVRAPGAVLEERRHIQALARTVSRWKRSAAMIPSAWAVRNVRRPGPERRGAVPMSAALRICQTVDGEIGCPSRAGSPWIRRWPHLGFSSARRRTSFFGAAGAGGRPVRPRRLEQSHFLALSLRCQASTVPGRTGKTCARRRRGISDDRAAHQNRSTGS